MYDVHEHRGIPVSAGIPPIVKVAAVIGGIIIFIIGGIVVGNSRYGHVFPASDAVNIKLSS